MVGGRVLQVQSRQSMRWAMDGIVVNLTPVAINEATFAETCFNNSDAGWTHFIRRGVLQPENRHGGALRGKKSGDVWVIDITKIS